MGAAERYLDILAMNPMVIGGRNVVRFASDVNGVLYQSIKGAAFSQLLPDAPPVVPLPGVLAVGGVTIPSLQAWFRADTGVTIASWASGASPVISALADQSGLGSRNLTAVGTPKLVGNSINGKPGIAVEPSTPSYLQNATTNLITTDRGERTVFMVGVARSTTVGGSWFQFRIGGLNLFNMEHRFSGGFLVQGGTQTQLGVPPGVPVLNTPHVFEYSFDARITSLSPPLPVALTDSAVRVIIDGLPEMVNSPGMSAAESGTTGFAFGTNTQATNVGWNGEISEVLVFNKDLSSKERRAVRRYLATKYGLTVTDPINIQWLGDSHLYGQGDATTLAAGGPRQELHGLHPRFVSKGSQYAPQTPDATQPQAGYFNYNDGYQAATSGKSGAAFIGGVNAVELMRSTKPDLVFLMIGTNDPLLGITDPLVTAQNVLDIVNYIAAVSPETRVIVCRDPLLSTAHGSAGTANPIITAQGPAIRNALTPAAAPNVLVSPKFGNVIILPTVADSFYADTVHLSPAGWHEMIRLAINPFLLSLNL